MTIFKKIYAVKCSVKLRRIKRKIMKKNKIKKLKNLSIVIPSKNEGPNLKYIIPKLKVLSSDILIVDSNSQDNTKKICELNKVRYIIDNCLGKGDAQRIGVKSSIFENIIFFDADGSHEINDVIKIYEYLTVKSFDLVITSRKTGGTLDTTSNTSVGGFVRAMGCEFLTLIFNILFKTSYSDILYSLKGIKKKKFTHLKTSENSFGIEIEILTKSLLEKYKIIEFPSRENKRNFGKSKLKTIVGLYFLYQIITYYLKYNFFSLLNKTRVEK